MSEVVIRESRDTEHLMAWRMEVLRCVFSLPDEADTSALEAQNCTYYEHHLADHSHIACIASVGGEEVGCGGVCLYDEMPSPENPTGRCAYLMNIYVRTPYRQRGIARRIVRWLTGQALSLGVTKIYLETSDAARELYAGMGFGYMKDMMKLEL